MARFASLRRLRRDFAAMRIFVACSAGQRREVIASRWLRFLIELRSMTLAACRSRVSAQQLESRVLMLGQRKCRRTESIQRVARLAFVGVTRILKLPAMRILMAIDASAVRHLVVGVFTGRFVTFGALNGCMFAHQRIGALLVHGHGEERRLESILAVTEPAILARKLALVRIGTVAVGALIMRHGLLEIAAFVTARASQLFMRSMQRELGLAVIEVGGQRPHQFPSRRHVAALARRGERSLMRVVMAIAASAEPNIGVRYEYLGVLCTRAVALRAGYSFMQPRQRIFCRAVVETTGRLPGLHRVAARAIGA